MIGRLRRRLTIEAANPTDDGHGGQSDPWASPVTVATVWARIEPLRGREALEAGRLEARHSHRVTIRYRDDVVAGQRARIGARIFNIRSVANRGDRDRWLELICVEGVAT